MRAMKAPRPTRRGRAWLSRLAGALVAGVLSLPALAGEAPADAPIAAGPAEAPPRVLVAAIAGWVAADLGLPIPDELPRIVRGSPGAMAAAGEGALRADGARSAGAANVVASYDTRTRTIYLPANWRGESPAEVSILVHEMVHHLQTLAGELFACPAAREAPAYAAQQRWLETFGETLEGAVGIDPLMLLVATNCMP